MKKNILFSLLGIILGIIAVRFFSAQHKWLGYLGVMLISVSCVYISYCIGFALFSNKKNKSLPALPQMRAYIQQQTVSPQPITKGLVAGALFSMLLSGLIFFWLFF